MEPSNLHFGGGVSQTVLNPFVAAFVLLAGVVILTRPRSQALTAFLTASILIPVDQVLLIGGVHFPMMRVLILFGLARLLKEKLSAHANILTGGMNGLDIAMLALTLVSAVTGILLFPEIGSLIFQVGNVYTVLGAYCFLRFMICDGQDVDRSMRLFAYIAVFLAVVMVYERTMGWNPYALLGGARAYVYSSIMARDDKFRAMGCFNHPILAGTFGAIMVPTFVGMWWKNKKHSTLAAIGMIAATIITIASNSSTPMLAYIAGIIGLCMWPVRRWMRSVRWGIVCTLISLHIVMKAPVWHLISRIDLAGGSSSYHRYQLVDQCIRHFSDWWFLGVKSTADWGWDMWDLSNQYVAIGETSGLLALICFVAVLVWGFKYLGRARKSLHGDRPSELFLWALSSAMFANVVAFIGISYFDQTQIVWYAFLAMISAVAVNARSPQAVTATTHADNPTKLLNSWEPTTQTAPQPASLTRIWG
jgi:hypothetical protein